MRFPKRDKREKFEIQYFIEEYKKLPNPIQFQIVRKRERPDYILKDAQSQQKYGVELTAIYLSDKSVPDHHLSEDSRRIPYDKQEIEGYKQRIIDEVIRKNEKACKGYDKTYPLILSVFINEYIRVYLELDDFKFIEKQIKIILKDKSAFIEIFFHHLSHINVYLIQMN